MGAGAARTVRRAVRACRPVLAGPHPPGLTLLVLVYLFAAYALVDGIFAIAAAFRPSARHTRGWWLLVEAVIGILTGLVTLFWPGITALVLLYFIAAWFVLTGVARITAAISLRREIENEWLISLSGVLSIVFGRATRAGGGDEKRGAGATMKVAAGESRWPDECESRARSPDGLACDTPSTGRQQEKLERPPMANLVINRTSALQFPTDTSS